MTSTDQTISGDRTAREFFGPTAKAREFGDHLRSADVVIYLQSSASMDGADKTFTNTAANLTAGAMERRGQSVKLVRFGGIEDLLTHMEGQKQDGAALVIMDENTAKSARSATCAFRGDVSLLVVGDGASRDAGIAQSFPKIEGREVKTAFAPSGNPHAMYTAGIGMVPMPLSGSAGVWKQHDYPGAKEDKPVTPLTGVGKLIQTLNGGST